MTSPFGTLEASKRLRDAGLEQRAAEAIVDLVQTAARMPDIGDLATKGDVRLLKNDLDLLATQMATKVELQSLRADLSEKLRLQGWALMGGMAALITVYTALLKLLT